MIIILDNEYIDIDSIKSISDIKDNYHFHITYKDYDNQHFCFNSSVHFSEDKEKLKKAHGQLIELWSENQKNYIKIEL